MSETKLSYKWAEAEERWTGLLLSSAPNVLMIVENVVIPA